MVLIKSLTLSCMSFLMLLLNCIAQEPDFSEHDESSLQQLDYADVSPREWRAGVELAEPVFQQGEVAYSGQQIVQPPPQPPLYSQQQQPPAAYPQSPGALWQGADLSSYPPQGPGIIPFPVVPVVPVEIQPWPILNNWDWQPVIGAVPPVQSAVGNWNWQPNIAPIPPPQPPPPPPVIVGQAAPQPTCGSGPVIDGYSSIPSFPNSALANGSGTSGASATIPGKVGDQVVYSRSAYGPVLPAVDYGCCFTRYTDTIIFGLETFYSTTGAYSLEECLAVCLTAKPTLGSDCQAVIFVPKSRSCNFYNASARAKPAKFGMKYGFDYYEPTNKAGCVQSQPLLFYTKPAPTQPTTTTEIPIIWVNTTKSLVSIKPSQANPKPSQASPKPSQASPKPSQASPKPSQASPKPSQASPKPSQASPKPTQKAQPVTTPPIIWVPASTFKPPVAGAGSTQLGPAGLVASNRPIVGAGGAGVNPSVGSSGGPTGGGQTGPSGGPAQGAGGQKGPSGVPPQGGGGSQKGAEVTGTPLSLLPDPDPFPPSSVQQFPSRLAAIKEEDIAFKTDIAQRPLNLLQRILPPSNSPPALDWIRPQLSLTKPPPPPPPSVSDPIPVNITTDTANEEQAIIDQQQSILDKIQPPIGRTFRPRPNGQGPTRTIPTKSTKATTIKSTPTPEIREYLYDSFFDDANARPNQNHTKLVASPNSGDAVEYHYEYVEN